MVMSREKDNNLCLVDRSVVTSVYDRFDKKMDLQRGESEWKRGRMMDKSVWKSLALAAVFVTGWALTSGVVGPLLVNAGLTPTQLDELKQFVAKYNAPKYTNFTYDQLKQYFESKINPQLRKEVAPRLFPFCVTAKQIEDPSRTRTTDKIRKFLQIIDDIEKVDDKFYNFKKSFHSIHPNQGQPNQWVEKITMSRINTPELDMVNLRQWVHIHVRMAHEDTKGLIMQSIVGPMGLPFGEFFLDFPCKDALQQTKDMNITGELSYCAYRPRTTIQHPSVYVGYDPKGRRDYHMHFFYTDITCMEMPYLQFLMLVVREFPPNETASAIYGEDYMPLLSEVYINTDFDSKSGAPFPYYPEWDNKMYCFLNEQTFEAEYTREFPGIPQPNDPLNPILFKYPSQKDGADGKYAPINWKTSEDVFRIQANEAFDACTTGRLKDKSLRDDERLECPPGPFRCDTSYADAPTREEVEDARVELLHKEIEVSNCIPCGAPPCVDLGWPIYKCDNKPDSIITDVNRSLELNSVESIIRGKSHGVQAMLAFLVLVPIANFVARFYKEVCGHCLCDNGPWIFIHTIAHILSLLFMWFSVGSVMPKLSEVKEVKKDCAALHPGDSLKQANCVWQSSASNPHVWIGSIAFIMEHFLVMFGFWRSKHVQVREIQVILHSHFGYCAWLLAAIATIIAGFHKKQHATGCNDIIIVSFMLFITPFIFSGAAVFLDCMTDKKIGIIPPRKQWPVLEPIKIEGRGPFHFPKWILLALFTGIMLLFWLLVVGSSVTVIGNAEHFFNPNHKRRLASLFGQCGDILGQARKRINNSTKRIE